MSRVVKFITLGLLISGILANGTNGPRQNDFGIRSQASNNGSGSSSAESVAEQKRFQDLPPTVFAPSGRLHMVEKVCAETTDPLDTTSPLVVAILCNGGKSVAVVSTTPISPHCSFDYQFMSDSNTTMHNTTLGNYSAPLLLELMDDATPDPLNPPLLSMIGPSFLIGTGGNAAEAIALHIKIQQVVLSLIQQEACTVHTIPTSLVARHVADMVQIPTQSVVDEDHPKMLAVSIKTRIVKLDLNSPYHKQLIFGSLSHNHRVLQYWLEWKWDMMMRNQSCHAFGGLIQQGSFSSVTWWP